MCKFSDNLVINGEILVVSTLYKTTLNVTLISIIDQFLSKNFPNILCSFFQFI
jgi:hypothetical protein